MGFCTRLSYVRTCCLLIPGLGHLCMLEASLIRHNHMPVLLAQQPLPFSLPLPLPLPLLHSPTGGQGDSVSLDNMQFTWGNENKIIIASTRIKVKPQQKESDARDSLLVQRPIGIVSNPDTINNQWFCSTQIATKHYCIMKHNHCITTCTAYFHSETYTCTVLSSNVYHITTSYSALLGVQSSEVPM